MTPSITISNIERIAVNTYSVFFTSNVNLNNLFYEISSNGTSWGSSVNLSGVTSPQTITVQDSNFFYVRLGSDYTPPYTRIHTNVFTEPFN